MEFMERLDLSVESDALNVEAAIHLARYSAAYSFAQGARVLDVACGEGYGSNLLAQAGATEVVGVDISADAIDVARSRFESSKTTFKCDDAMTLSSLSGKKFDLIVSLETFEHVPNAIGFLTNLLKFAHEKTIFVISCPNDNWYYPRPEQSNPFHTKKYFFEEFREASCSVLGNDVAWSFGAGSLGFINVPENVANTRFNWDNTNYRVQNASYLVPREIQDLDRTCAYFLGTWNANFAQSGGAATPLNLDEFFRAIPAINGEPISPSFASDATHQKLEKLELLHHVDDLKLESLQSSFREQGEKHELRYHVNELKVKSLQNSYLAQVEKLRQIQDELAQVVAQRDALITPAGRYLKLVSLVPAWMKNLIRKLLPTSKRH